MVATGRTDPYDIFSPASQRNAALYDRMRVEDPVHAAINPRTGGRCWFLTRYEDCLNFLKDKRFGRDYHHHLPAHLAEKWAAYYPEDSVNQHMLTLDDPAHARLKSLVQLAFTPQRISDMRPRIQALADSLFDSIDRDVADGDEFDLTGRYISQLPLMTLAEMLGIPRADYPALYRWTHGMLSTEQPIARRAIAEFSGYLQPQFDQRRKQPDAFDDLLSGLVFAEEAGDKLSHEELMAMVYLLITAGYETMVNFVSNGILTLFEHSDQLRRLQDNLHDPAVVRSAVEEMLRYSGPSHMTLPTWAYEDVEIGGRRIPQGDIVYAVLFAANRDPQVFDDPHKFDIMRQPNKHIAFSYGIHHCLGAALARLQGEVAFSTLLRRMPNL